MVTVKFKPLKESAIRPEKKHRSDLGYDIYLSEETIIIPGRNLVPLSIAIELPYECGAIIKPRSSVSARGVLGNDGAYHDADVIDGVIDPGYRGELALIIKSSEIFTIRRGTRLAQLILIPNIESTMQKSNHLSISDRGDDGFGSTGI